MRLSVAIDGPAGAGKSTIAKMVGDRFNLMYINTGAMYRAVTLMAMRNDISPMEIDKLCRLIDSLNMHFEKDDLIVNGENVGNEITMPIISNNVSNYAAIPEVREKLVKLQKEISRKYNVIMDGRDIGTVVLKDAPFKFYLTASAEERAKRRYNELNLKGVEIEYNQILSDIEKRDYIDTNRETNPLRKSEDAILIDSSNLNIDDVVALISKYIEDRLGL